MNILIVDDQPSVISSLKSGINWSDFNIGNIYTALDAQEARECILSHDIDILLTDIEMPVENGLSLLRWCRKEGYDFECIFLTSHADFFYAQEAMQLGSFDYLLQPARYEDVENTIQKTILRILEKRQNQDFIKYGKAAVSQKNHLFKGLFDDILSGNDTDINEIISTMRELNYPITMESSVYLLHLDILGWHSVPLNFSEWRQESSNILNEIFSHTMHHVLNYCPNKTSVIAMIYSTGDTLMSSELYHSRINRVYTQLTRHLGCSCAIYTTIAFQLTELSDSAKKIRQMRFNNVSLSEGLYFYSQQDKPQTITHCDRKLLECFTLYMINNTPQKAEQEALFYLQQLNLEAKLNYDTLITFCHDYQQAAYYAAKELNLPLDSLPSYEELSQPYENKIITLEATSAYIKQLTTFFQSQLTENQSTQDMFAKIDAYIQNNLDKSLTCTEVAKAIYLSPDYITRILQREKGISLKEYITQSKMLTARNLLRSTNLPVSLIAAKMGYSNFSHFSKVYKKIMGTVPSAERTGTPC